MVWAARSTNGLAQEFAAGAAPVHPGLVAAPLHHRSDARALLLRGRRRETLANFRRRPRATAERRSVPRQVGRQRTGSRIAEAPARPSRFGARDAGRQHPQLWQQGFDQQARRARDRRVVVQRPLFTNGLDALLDARGAKDVAGAPRASSISRRARWACSSVGRRSRKSAKMAVSLRKPLLNLRKVGLECVGDAIGQPRSALH